MKKFLFGLLMIGLSSLVWADGLTDLQAFNQHNGFKGTFTQTVSNAKNSQTSSGHFTILRPLYFKWQYTKPVKQLMVGDGQTVWFYDQDLDQVMKQSETKALQGTPAVILLDKTTLNSAFNLKNDGSESGVEYVMATPKKTGGGYRYIRLGFKNKIPYSIDLKDSLGNVTHLVLQNITTKTNLSAKDFNFNVPSGVDIQDLDVY